MKQVLTIFICLLVVATVACKKRRTNPEIPANELHYKELQCYNPWTRMSTHLIPESDTITIKNWLLENGIISLKISITKNNLETCKACTCPSGRTIRVLFNSADIEKAKTLGFYKP